MISQELFDKICKFIEEPDRSLRQACQEYGISTRTFYNYLDEIGETAKQQYARAMSGGCDAMADEILRISNDDTDPRDRQVRIDARKWILSKRLPKRYGDHQVIEIQSEMGKIIDKIVPAILKYVPDDKRSEAMNEIQASLDFDAQ